MTPEQLLALDHAEFTALVDQDARARDRTKADPKLAAALRHPDVIERTYMAVLAIQKKVEATLAGRAAEFASTKAHYNQQANRNRNGYLKLLEKYELSRANSLRYKTGVDQVVLELQYLIGSSTKARDLVRTDERFLLAQRVQVLEDGIRRHRDVSAEMDLAGEPHDEELWALV